MRKLMNRKIAQQHGKCALCGGKFTDYSDVVPDHLSPRDMGGAWRATITPTTFRRCTGGATERRDPPACDVPVSAIQQRNGGYCGIHSKRAFLVRD
jgi:hypothetical protein